MRLKQLLLNSDDIIASFAFITITVVTIIGVFMRYVMNSPFEWIEEFCIVLFTWFIFVGTSSITKRDEHVGIDYFVRKLQGKPRLAVEIFREIMILVVIVFVFINLGSQLSTHAWDKVTPVLGVRYTFIDIAVVLGGALGFVHIILRRFKKGSTLEKDRLDQQAS